MPKSWHGCGAPGRFLRFAYVVQIETDSVHKGKSLGFCLPGLRRLVGKEGAKWVKSDQTGGFLGDENNHPVLRHWDFKLMTIFVVRFPLEMVPLVENTVAANASPGFVWHLILFGGTSIYDIGNLLTEHINFCIMLVFQGRRNFVSQQNLSTRPLGRGAEAPNLLLVMCRVYRVGQR